MYTELLISCQMLIEAKFYQQNRGELQEPNLNANHAWTEFLLSVFKY